MKLAELRVKRLKQELSKLALLTIGTKTELQKRLREELRNRGIEVDTYYFEDEEERELLTPVYSSGIDISSVLAATMEKMEIANQKLLAE